MGFLVEGFILMICCNLFFQDSSGLGSPYLSATSSLDIGQHRFLTLQYDRDIAPASSKKNHGFGKRIHRVPPQPHPKKLKPSLTRKEPYTDLSPHSLPSSRGRMPNRAFPSPAIPSHRLHMPSHSPAVSPMSSINDEKTLQPLPSTASPNQKCPSLACTEPLTYAPPGAPCACVWPIQVKLHFSIPLYAFLPLISELSDNISTSIPLNRSQVRVMGADAANQQFDKTAVLINLVPLEQMFKSATAFSIYSKFWNKELSIKASVFGFYDVLYVHYPGLPPSAPSQPSAYAAADFQPYPGTGDGNVPVKPLGVYVPQRKKNHSGNKNMVLIVILSSVTAFIACMGFILLLLAKCGCCGRVHKHDQQSLASLDEKASGSRGSEMSRSRPSSASVSYTSSVLVYSGTAKIFTIEDMERATDSFNASRILGEGGFGIVYGGILDDGRNVAVKVLKRSDQQGSREFLSEVEMLSRLHHRNLVKLIGICAEDHSRCLVYELVPNGSVDSHLHGADKEVGPLEWRARMKIALGSARGLAYLHEDSSPRVIHRDFKSSNILLEHDYTPKVSDFGLARAAMEEQSKHISTHVMGTFGYLAPEYAMTGHLLVKSDVYSYGVVLLELLTGRKPIDMSRPPGQENLVAWVSPLLATRQGLEMIIDPTIKPNVPLDSFAKVAAIASMCVQPEVSNRPFMGEVVQALKLVCDEFEETREPVSKSFSYEGLDTDRDELVEELEKCNSMCDAETALSAVGLERESESFRRQFNSAPLKAGRQQSFWQRVRGLSRGSMSEQEYASKL